MPQTRFLPPIHSARPALTREMMARTGLDETMLADLVQGFYDKVREVTSVKLV